MRQITVASAVVGWIGVMTMAIDEAIELLNIERVCVRHADVCDRECGKCSLVQDTDELLEMYDSVCDWLEELKVMRNLDKTNFSDGYNRGIDDFLKEADATFPMQNDGTTVLRRLEKIADRLKGGGSCE